MKECRGCGLALRPLDSQRYSWRSTEEEPIKTAFLVPKTIVSRRESAVAAERSEKGFFSGPGFVTTPPASGLRRFPPRPKKPPELPRSSSGDRHMDRCG